MPIKSKERNRQGHCYPPGMEVGQNWGLAMSDREKSIAKLVRGWLLVSLSISALFLWVSRKIPVQGAFWT